MRRWNGNGRGGGKLGGAVMCHGSGGVVWVLAVVATSVSVSCVRRTLTIDSDPQGAMVYLNDEEVGPTPVSRDFIWYGDYDVVLRKEGYATLRTHAVVKAPLYQYFPTDFFVDVLWPGELHDQHHFHFVLDPWTPPEESALLSRAMELRERSARVSGVGPDESGP